MRYPKLTLRACVPVLACLLPLALAAETNCEDGNGRLNSAAPQGISVQEQIQK